MFPIDFVEKSSNLKGFKNPVYPTYIKMIVEIPGPYSEINKGFNL